MTVSIIFQFKNRWNTDSNEFIIGHFNPVWSRDMKITVRHLHI